MTPEGTPGTPIYARIAADLAARITVGQLAGRLSPERNIARDYNVAYATARHAIAALRQRGLITTPPGIGAFPTPAAEDDTGDDAAGSPPSAVEMIAFIAILLGQLSGPPWYPPAVPPEPEAG